jgi:RNA polymerase sigma-70 factor (ECF subfamily)
MLGRQSRAEGARRSITRSDPREEARLLDRVAKGDLRAFEELYRIYHPRLSRFLASVIRRPHLVEEALNDTMLAVWSRPDSYSGASKPSTWIFAIAYRKALKTLRSQDEPVEDKQAETRQSAEPGPEQELGRREAQAALAGAIAGLSADHRAVVDLCYFHEIGYREIAEIMDCPVDTVKTRMFHARRHLKTKLAGGLADWL